MSTDDSGPAFPTIDRLEESDYGMKQVYGASGMSLRQYAAIHLRVPNSGLDWLDEMIREANGEDRKWPDDSTGCDWSATQRAYAAERTTQPDYYDGEWHTWEGGECPIDGMATVEVQLRDGEIISNNHNDAFGFEWHHFNENGDIIRFRVVKP